MRFFFFFFGSCFIAAPLNKKREKKKNEKFKKKEKVEEKHDKKNVNCKFVNCMMAYLLATWNLCSVKVSDVNSRRMFYDTSL